MATVNKDFKIKSGLVVEGTTATVNGYDILTKKPADDQYIIDLIGGETLVKSVSNEFDVSVAGELSIDRATVDAYYDAAGDAAAAETAANLYTDGRETAITTAYEAYADQAEVDAKAYTDTREIAITSAYESYADTAETDAKAYTDTRETAITTAYQSYADIAADGAILGANTYTDNREIAITTAYEAYADQAELDAVATANAYTDTEIAALVDSAPALLDTLNELAAAIGDNPNYAVDLAASVGEKVAKAGDTMTGLLVLSADPSANLGAATKQYVDAAQSAAEDYADTGLALKQDTLIPGDGLDVNGANLTVNSGEMVNKVVNGVSGNSYGIVGNATYLDVTNPTAYNSEIDIDIAALESKLTTDGFASQTDISDAIDAVDTDAIEEGSTNLYFTDSRAKTSAADLLTGATLSNIVITGSGSGLTITAENGVAGSTTDDLTEGEDNLYFTDSRAIDAINTAAITPGSVQIAVFRKEEATQQTVASASTVNVHGFVSPYTSAKYLVTVTGAVGGVTHSQLTEILVTTDSNNNIAITEYGTICTDTSNLASFSATYANSSFTLTATTAVNNCQIMAAATLLQMSV